MAEQTRPHTAQSGPPNWLRRIESAAEGMPAWLMASGVVVLLAGPLFLAAVAARIGFPVFWPTYVVSLSAMLALFWRLRTRPALLVGVVIIWFAFHKLLIALSAPGLDPHTLAWLQNYKEPMYLGLFAVGAAAVGIDRLHGRTFAVTSADLLAASVLLVTAIYFVASVTVAPDSLESQVVYARRFASLPLIFLAGRLLLPKTSEFTVALRLLVGVAVLVAVFGLIERLILGDGFWTGFAHVGALQDSLVEQGFASPRSRLLNGLPANWTSFLDGVQVRRLVSTFLEPTTLGLFLAFAASVSIFALSTFRPHARTITLLAATVLSGALLLTIGKAGYAALAIMAVIVVLRGTRRSAPLIGVVVAVMAIGALLAAQFLPFDANIDRHLRGLASGIGQVLQHPLGTGLGSTGFWGERGLVGLDSTLGAIASQMGVIGAVSYLGWLITAAWQLLPEEVGRSSFDASRRLLSAGLIALLVVSVVSNSASGLLAGFAYVLFAGWATSIALQRAQAKTRQARPHRRGLMIAWMPYSRRSTTIAERLDFDLLLVGRPAFRRPWTAPFVYPAMALRSLAAVIRGQPSAVLIAAPPFVAALVVVPLCRLLRIPVGVDVHSGALLDRKWRWSVPLLAWISRRADVGIVTLEQLAVSLRRRGVKALVLADPIPRLNGTSVPSPLGGNRLRPVAVAICGWGDDEPLAELIEAASNRPWDLLITGKPRRDLSLPSNVHLTGFTSDEEYARLLSRADLILVLTRRENTLLSGAWEALALERPFLVSNTRALRETFGPYVASVESDAHSIRIAVENHLQDPEAASQARQLAERYRIENDRAVALLRQHLLRAFG